MTRFKEATEAYQVLSDEEKRNRYDRFGHAGVEGMSEVGGDIFSHFQDIFSEFFGGIAGGNARRHGGPARGPDIRVQQRLTLKDAMLAASARYRCAHPSPARTVAVRARRRGPSESSAGRAAVLVKFPQPAGL